VSLEGDVTGAVAPEDSFDQTGLVLFTGEQITEFGQPGQRRCGVFRRRCEFSDVSGNANDQAGVDLFSQPCP